MVPGQIINISIGSGGIGAANEASDGGDGGNTVVSGIPVPGGRGAKPSLPGRGGNNITTIYYAIYGNNGMPTTETYSQRLSAEWATARKYGDGGKAILIDGSEGTGSVFTFNTATLLNISLVRSTDGMAAGAGGGGGPNFGVLWGSSGAAGMVVIRY